MALYTVAYNYCTSSRMHGALDQAQLGGRSKLIRAALEINSTNTTVLKAGANLMGSDLYNHLIRYFNTHLIGLKAVRTLERSHSYVIIGANLSGPILYRLPIP